MLDACSDFLRGVCTNTGKHPGNAMEEVPGRCGKGLSARSLRGERFDLKDSLAKLSASPTLP